MGRRSTDADTVMSNMSDVGDAAFTNYSQLAQPAFKQINSAHFSRHIDQWDMVRVGIEARGHLGPCKTRGIVRMRI